MKGLHTAYWHSGDGLHQQSQREEQTLSLTRIEQDIYSKNSHVLLIAVDGVDTESSSQFRNVP